MKILFILPYIPYPLNSGGNQATFNMINKVRNLHEVSLLLHISTEKDEENAKGLQEVWKNVQFFLYRQPRSKKRKLPDNSPYPNSFLFRTFDFIHRSMERKMIRRINKFEQRLIKDTPQENMAEEHDFIRNNSCLNKNVLDLPKDYLNFVYKTSRAGFDMIQVEFYEYLPLIYVLPETTVKAFVQHEIRFIRNKNEMNLFAQQTPNDFYRIQYQKDMEMSMLSHYDVVISLTDTDKEILLQENPNLNVYVSPAVVSLPKIHSEFKAAQELVFIGSGSHFPNTDGVIWFCKEVMPILRKKKESVKLNVVGVWDEETRNIIGSICPDVHFTGFVDNLSDFLSGKISIVPIRIGSGMRMKILDSIVASSPIVTTSKGCEGLPVTNQKNCLIADTPSDFAQALIQLVDNTELQKEIVSNAHHEFASVFDFDKQIERRIKLYEQYAHTIKH